MGFLLGRLLKNAHLLRCAYHSSLLRTQKHAPFLLIACKQVSETARALHLCIFEQPVKKTFHPR